jgi:hypothetical protein
MTGQNYFVFTSRHERNIETLLSLIYHNELTTLLQPVFNENIVVGISLGTAHHPSVYRRRYIVIPTAHISLNNWRRYYTDG